MSKHVMSQFESKTGKDGVLYFSFRMEDSGPGVAFEGTNPKINAVVKITPHGELIIQGAIADGTTPASAVEPTVIEEHALPGIPPEGEPLVMTVGETVGEEEHL